MKKRTAPATITTQISGENEGQGNRQPQQEPSQKRRKVTGEYEASHEMRIPDTWPLTPQLDEWDINKYPFPDDDGFFIICEGARRSGKSVFMKYMLYHYRDTFDLVLVFTYTAMNGYWQPIVGNKYVHNGWKPELIKKILKDQKNARIEEEKNNLQFGKDQHDKKAKRLLLIIDDIIGDRRKIHDDVMLNTLAVEGRHSFVSVILATQQPTAIGTALRNNADAVVIFQQKGRKPKDSVIDDFLMYKCDNRDQAKDLLNTYTQNHDAILIRMDQMGPSIKNTYFHVPEYMTYDSEKGEVRVPEYQMGSVLQKTLAKTIQGRVPVAN